MDIPGIMKSFGESNSGSLLDSQIKPITLMAKDREKKKPTNIFMDFDLDADEISFQLIPFDEDEEEGSAHQFNYFGNNQAAASQIYAVRDASGMLNFWTGRPAGVFLNLMKLLPEGELKELFQECVDAELILDSGPNCEKMAEGLTVDRSAKAFMLGEEKLSPEKFLIKNVDGSGSMKVMLVIPRIRKDGRNVVISTHPDYVTAILGTLQQAGSGSEGVCHICGQLKPDLNTKEYSSKFYKGGLGKVFVTTTVNYAPDFQKSGHQRNYGICKDCYEKLMFGERRVMSDFHIRIAKEDCILMFEGLDRPIDPEMVDQIKRDVDVVFNPRETREWSEQFQAALRIDGVEVYQFSIIFYKTDGKSCNISKTIESINSVRFNYVRKVFDEARIPFGTQLPSFAIGHLYQMVPVFSNKKGEQVDVGRLLDLYGAILKGEPVERKHLFELFADCMERGIKSIGASEVRNYKNLYSLSYLNQLERGKRGGRDWFITRECLYYLALIRAMQKLGILSEEVLDLEEEKKMPQPGEWVKGIDECERFLTENGFSKEAKGLFYLGMLVYQIGFAQYKQGHYLKPILDKLNYRGMDKKETVRFAMEVLEKVRQYKAVLAKAGHLNFCELLYQPMMDNLGNIADCKLFSEQENLFYILSGYSFSINTRPRKTEDGGAEQGEPTDDATDQVNGNEVE